MGGGGGEMRTRRRMGRIWRNTRKKVEEEKEKGDKVEREECYVPMLKTAATTFWVESFKHIS